MGGLFFDFEAIRTEASDRDAPRRFGRYPSLARAKVIRNKHTNKSKGYAFISFMDPFDCAKALREMSGKYIGNRRVSRRLAVLRCLHFVDVTCLQE